MVPCPDFMKKIIKAFLVLIAAVGLVRVLMHFRKYQDPKLEIHDLNEVKDFEKHSIKQAEEKRVFIEDFGLKSKKTVCAGVLILMLTAIGSESFLKPFGSLLKTALIAPETIEFDGMTPPVKQVPNWVTLSDNEFRAPFDSIPKSKLMPLPPFDEAKIKKGQQSKWGENDTERNMYITYPVLHMGDYKLEANHDTGSHIGVDIKLPIGTPIYSMGNGIVEQVKNINTGFGKHIVIRHPNVPINNDPNRTQTLYSTYAHLSVLSVKEGQRVKKGELIGKSGNSGNATAPHLHFQLEKENAPFRPYWPFTWQDQQKANLSYFEAINKGLNKQNGYQYTLDPMEMIAQYKDYQGATLVKRDTPVAQVTAVEVKAEPEKVVVETNEPEVKNEAPKEEITVVRENVRPERESQITTQNDEPERRSVVMTNKNNPKGIVIETDRSFIPGQTEVVRIRLEDENLLVSNGIQLNTTLRQLATIQPSNLQEKHFTNGIAEVLVKTESDSSFRLIAEGGFGEIKSDSLRAYVFNDIPRTHTYGDAIKYLKDNQIVNGYADGTFRPESGINRAEAVKILLVGNSIPVKNNANPFSDVITDSWYEDYVTTASSEGIVKGYSDGTFKPEQNVSRAEFLKLALESANIALPTKGENYKDIPAGAWFESYFLLAYRHKLLGTSGGGNVDPGKAITRGEAAFIMYKISELN